MRVFSALFLLFAIPAFAQSDSLVSRIVFIGDAGEMGVEQNILMPDAAGKIIPGKTAVMFLGDNIYPRGMGLPGSPEEEKTKEILRSQFAPMRAAGAPVYFIPGNHDWDKMGPNGLAKIKRQSDFLAEQKDPLLRMIPANGCPDPVAVKISENLTIIALDSEWWLFPYDKTNEGAGCECTGSQDVLNALQELLHENRDKIILLATHHPFQTYGTHGGNFSVKDHIFPLTAVNKNLYIPLPVLGSVYPLLRKTFVSPEDAGNPLYKNMIARIDGVFKGFPNIIHVSGHEHGLQLIKNTETQQIQVVSGGGAKENYTIKGKYSLFGKSGQGYVIADLMKGNILKFTYYTFNKDKNSYVEAFQYRWNDFKELNPQNRPAFTASATVFTNKAAALPKYDEAGKFHRFLFGENYRKEWAQPVVLPTFNIDTLHGGLTPLKLGGGFQSVSLRLEDAGKKEYTLRLLEKKVDKLVPAAFTNTFITDWLDDATSSQHPYSSLIVPPLAKAVGVPHANPEIGIVKTSESLGIYNSVFANKIALLEEREPLGDSDNFEKAIGKLQEDNDHVFDGKNFVKARLLDLVLGDWDRHPDQWRFYNRNEKGQGKNYILIPRDRDMVLNKAEGVLASIIKGWILMPQIAGFKADLLPKSDFYFYKSAFLNQHPSSQISYEEWMQIARETQASLSDEVIEKAVKQLPEEIYRIRHEEIGTHLKSRRDQLTEAAEKYYKLSNEIVDIQLSDKNEQVSITESTDKKGVQITVKKINKDGEIKNTLMSKNYLNDDTREIRLYLGNGNDSLKVDIPDSKTKIRVIGGKGEKVYTVDASSRNINLYDSQPANYFGNDASKLRKHISADSLNTAFVRTNLYHTYLPFITGGYNLDDGVSLGLGVRFTLQKGFRKTPYRSVQTISARRSFSTEAYDIKYKGEWLHAFGKADFVMDVNIKAPNNTQNFFGRGNETEFNRFEGFKKYYRARFNTVTVNPALRWRTNEMTISAGPAFEYYKMKPGDNEGRFIANPELINNYDAETVFRDKSHVGIAANLQVDKRDNPILPTFGYFIDLNARAMTGLNRNSGDFLQVAPQFAFYKSLNSRQTIVLANRTGGGFTLGESAFYQSLFLGNQDNLYGYRMFRFAGAHSLYNNFEIRAALLDFGSYIFSGQLGLVGFYDVGKVWAENENSKKFHNGVGMGIYIAPAKMAVLRFNMGYSTEGWYPSFTIGSRF